MRFLYSNKYKCLYSEYPILKSRNQLNYHLHLCFKSSTKTPDYLLLYTTDGTFFIYNDEEIEFSTSLMICAKDDYSKVHYYQIPNPASEKPPIFTKTCSNFDARGIPHNVTQVIYDGKGNVRLHETYRIENVRLNIPIPKEVFEFNPPDDYVVRDFRLPAAERQAAKIEVLKRRLKGKDRGAKLEALVRLREYLKDNPDEMREIAVSLLKDEHYSVRFWAFGTLIPLLRDNPEQLRHIATCMLNDEDSRIQSVAARVLQRIEPKKEEQ